MAVRIIALIISNIPAVLLYFYLRNLRKGDSEYGKDCAGLLKKGVLSCIGVVLLAAALTITWNLTLGKESMPLLKELFSNFVLAALVEEYIKYRAADKVLKKQAGKASWLDCIAFFGIVGIGFQIIESFTYMLNTNIPQILVRGFAMGHPSYGLLMGYLVGKSLKTGKKSYRVMAFMAPFMLHGMYDFSLSELFQGINENMVFVPFILVITELVILIRTLILIKKNRNNPEYTEPLA